MLRIALLRRAGAAVGLAFGGGALLSKRSREMEQPAGVRTRLLCPWLGCRAAAVCEGAPPASGLPTYTKAEVAKHKKAEDGIWVTLGDKVTSHIIFSPAIRCRQAPRDSFRSAATARPQPTPPCLLLPATRSTTLRRSSPTTRAASIKS